MSQLNDITAIVSDLLKNEVTVKTTIGKPFNWGEAVIIPVIRGKIGMRRKGKEKEITADEQKPIGFFSARGNEIQFVAMKNSQELNALFERLLTNLENYLDKKYVGKVRKERITTGN